MHFPALQNQHGACFRTEEERLICSLFYLFFILCVSLQSIIVGVREDAVKR